MQKFLSCYLSLTEILRLHFASFLIWFDRKICALPSQCLSSDASSWTSVCR